MADVIKARRAATHYSAGISNSLNLISIFLEIVKEIHTISHELLKKHTDAEIRYIFILIETYILRHS